MPTYTFRNTSTGEVMDKFLNFSSKDKFLEENPEFEIIITAAPAVCDPVRVGVRKKDTGFKEVLQKIHEKTPGSDLKKNNVI